MTGWFKLWRKIDDWQWRQSPNHVSVFLFCLTRACYQESSFKHYSLCAGSLATSYLSISEKTGLSIKQVRKVIKDLKRTGEILHIGKSDCSIITVKKWGTHQCEDGSRAHKGHSKGFQRALKGQHIKNIRNKEINNNNYSAVSTRNYTTTINKKNISNLNHSNTNNSNDTNAKAHNNIYPPEPINNNSNTNNINDNNNKLCTNTDTHILAHDYMLKQGHTEKIINAWNNVALRKKCNGTTKQKIELKKKINKKISLEEYCNAFKNYWSIVENEKYIFKYEWTLIQFLTRESANKFYDGEFENHDFQVNSNYLNETRETKLENLFGGVSEWKE